MVGVVRIIALAVAGGALAGCMTDGLVGPEAEGLSAKPRVVDTPKTRTAATSTASKKNSGAPASAGEPRPAPQAAAIHADGEITPNARPTAATAADATLIPAQSLFGNWTLGENGAGRKCRIILGGVLIGAAYSARSEADCPQAFTSVQTWEIQGDELILRNQTRAVVGRLQPTGPFRFDGQANDGGSFYLVR